MLSCCENIENKTVHKEDCLDETFRYLCREMEMDIVLEDDPKYTVQKDSDEEKRIYYQGEVYDDRGELYLTLLKLATFIYPNTATRGLVDNLF